MTAITLAILSLIAQSEYDKAKSDFKRAILTQAYVDVRGHAAVIAKSDNPGAVDALLDGYGLTAGQLKLLWLEKLKCIQEAEANSDIEWITDEKGSHVKPGSESKFRKLEEAQKAGREVESRIINVGRVKAEIVKALALFKSDAAVRALIARLKKDKEWERRAGIAEALGLSAHADALPALYELLKSDAESGVKVACIDAVAAKAAAMKLAAPTDPTPPAVIAALAEHVKSEFWQIKFAAATALAGTGSKLAVEPIIEGLNGADGRMKTDLNVMLVALTGADKRGDYSAWRAWFETNKDALLASKYEPKEEDKPRDESAGTSATFYGIPVRSKNVVFVIDVSGSMEWKSEWSPPEKSGPAPVPTGPRPGPPPADPYEKPASDKKIDVARWQLLRCVNGLSDGTEFNVIFFSSTFTVMSDKMVKMSSKTRKESLAFIEKLAHGGGTNIFDSLERAFTFASAGAIAGDAKDKLVKSSVDTIFLLTDGMPTAGQVTDTAKIKEKLLELNKVKKIAINTIGVFTTNPPPEQPNEKQAGEKFLSEIAEAHKGIFVNASTGTLGGGKK